MKFQAVTGHHIEFSDLDDYAELEAEHDFYAPHRCHEMEDAEKQRLKAWGVQRAFGIIYHPTTNKWFMYNGGVAGMEVVQCPFCGTRLFTGNQVTIE